MNLRQKAKKYKQRVEELENMALPTRTIIQDKTNLIRYKSCYSMESYENFGVARLHAQHKFLSELKEIIDYNIEFNNKDTFKLEIWLKK